MNAALPHEIRQAVTDRIEALTPASAYRHTTADAWREAESPLVPEWEPAAIAHLSFFVDDRDLDNIETHRGRVEDAVEWPMVRAPFTVRFLYAVRPVVAHQLTDWDNASKAAVALIRHVLAEGWQDLAVITLGARPIARLPAGGDGDPYLRVEVQFRALYELSLALQE